MLWHIAETGCRFQWEEESSELLPDLPDSLLEAVAIPAEEILGAYRVVFTRE